jgi:quercetin dioxygenase-like cupin family protein
MLFVRLPVGWSGDWHPAPKRQFGILIEGELEVTASDGEVRTFKAGDVRLLEDTSGKGHQTKVLGDRDVLNTIIQLD